MKDPAVVPTSKRWTRSPLPRPRPEQRFPATRAWRSPQPTTVIHLKGGDSIVRSQVRGLYDTCSGAHPLVVDTGASDHLEEQNGEAGVGSSSHMQHFEPQSCTATRPFR